jgi:hypothetical protein
MTMFCLSGNGPDFECHIVDRTLRATTIFSVRCFSEWTVDSEMSLKISERPDRFFSVNS